MVRFAEEKARETTSRRATAGSPAPATACIGGPRERSRAAAGRSAPLARYWVDAGMRVQIPNQKVTGEKK